MFKLDFRSSGDLRFNGTSSDSGKSMLCSLRRFGHLRETGPTEWALTIRLDLVISTLLYYHSVYNTVIVRLPVTAHCIRFPTTVIPSLIPSEVVGKPSCRLPRACRMSACHTLGPMPQVMQRRSTGSWQWWRDNPKSFILPSCNFSSKWFSVLRLLLQVTLYVANLL